MSEKPNLDFQDFPSVYICFSGVADNPGKEINNQSVTSVEMIAFVASPWDGDHY